MSNSSPLPLQPPEEYRAERPHIFRSTESLRWYLRRHGAELAECGAVVVVGRKLINPSAFDQAVLTIGARLAKPR